MQYFTGDGVAEWTVSRSTLHVTIKGHEQFVGRLGSSMAAARPSPGGPHPANQRRHITLLDGQAIPLLRPSEARGATVIVAEAVTQNLAAIAVNHGCLIVPPPSCPLAAWKTCELVANRDPRAEALQPLRLGRNLEFNPNHGSLEHEGTEIPLSSGELTLLQFLVDPPTRWRTVEEIGKRAFGRSDCAARQLVWKYASKLRRRLPLGSAVFESSRRFGYRVVPETMA